MRPLSLPPASLLWRWSWGQRAARLLLGSVGLLGATLAASAAGETGAPAATPSAAVAEARELWHRGDPVGALAALGDDTGPEATELRQRLQRETGASLERARTRQQLLDEVDAAWQRPAPAARPAPEAPAPDSVALRERLRSVVLPRVSFTDAPLSQVLDTLATLAEEAAPLADPPNLVLIDPDRRDPPLTITLRRLSLERILDFVTEAAGFEYEVQPDAVVVRPSTGPALRLETEFFPLSRSTLIRLAGVEDAGTAAALAQPDPNAPPTATGPAAPGAERRAEEALRGFLQRAGVPFDTIPGAALALAGGQLIVTNTPRHLERARNVLRRYHETRQVEIEARFLEVQDGALEELGTRFQVRGGDGAGGTIGLGGTATAPLRTVGQAVTPGVVSNRGSIVVPGPGGVSTTTPLTATAPNLPNTLNTGTSISDLLSMSSVIGGVEVQALLRALSQRTGSDLLSAPKVTVLSGKTASITVAQELRYPTRFSDTNSQVGRGESGDAGSAGVAITAGTPQDFVVRNIGVEMAVTPTVEDNDAISLVLEPRVTEFDGFVEYGGQSVAIASGTTVTVPSGFFQPVFSVRSLKTEVTLWDGATVVMGGLTREEVRTVRDKVPILGSIPLLGGLFRSRGEAVQKRNLLVFVTANLVSPGGSPARQELPELAPGTLFQAPVLITPERAEPRAESPAPAPAPEPKPRGRGRRE